MQSRKKVVVPANRYECVYKQTDEPSVPFYKKRAADVANERYPLYRASILNTAMSAATCNNDIILLPHRFLLDFKRFSSFYPYQFQRQNKSLLQDLFYHKTILFTRPFSKFLVKILPLHFRQFDLIGYVAYEPDNHFLL